MAGMAQTFADLTSLSIEDLISKHDQEAETTGTHVNYYLEELRYRRSQEVAKRIFQLTHRIFWLTLVVTVATIVVTVATIINVWF